MAKLKNSLIKKRNENIAFENKQKALRKKYNVEAPKEQVIVEKNSTAKYLILGIGNILQVTATVIILVLAVIGITTLAHPELRRSFFTVMSPEHITLSNQNNII